ncbi:Gr2p [Chamberlinius hualienensis]
MLYVSTPQVVDKDLVFQNKNKIVPKKSYFSTIKPIVMLAGFFGILPVSVSPLRYRWLSIRVVYTAAWAAIMAAVCVSTIRNTVNLVMGSSATNAKEMTSILAGWVFRDSALFSLLYFWYVATQLSDLMSCWEESSSRLIKYVEISKRHLHYPKKYSVLISIVLLSSCFLDRALHDARFINYEVMCNADNITVDSFSDCYLLKNGDYLVGLFGFNKWATAASLVISVINSFTWNFLDLFIIIISCGLNHYFVHINMFMERNKRNRFRVDEWKSLREDHLAVAKLVENVDKVLSLGVLYCYTANLISICTQMFLGLRPKTSAIFETSYTTVSFLHLVGRTAAVTWTASRINDSVRFPF